MAATEETLRFMRALSAQVDASVDAATRQLVRSWGQGWNLVVGDWEAAAAQLQAARLAGGVPTVSQIVRAEKAQAALAATYEGLQELSEYAGVTITAGSNQVIHAASEGHIGIMTSQLPQANQAVVRAFVKRADTDQIRSIIVRTQERVTKTLFPLPGDADATIRQALVRGVQQGTNPKAVARQIVQGVHTEYGRSLTRAMVVARTEMLDAHRAAAAVQHQANADLLRGWEWVAALDHRTCPACWAQHGTEHKLSEPGPLDHQQGRCVRLPLTKSWSDLGFNIPEPPSLVPDAEERFAQLTPRQQLRIMGPARLEAWRNGTPLSAMATRRSNIGWRDSYGVTPVSKLPDGGGSSAPRTPKPTPQPAAPRTAATPAKVSFKPRTAEEIASDFSDDSMGQFMARQVQHSWDAGGHRITSMVKLTEEQAAMMVKAAERSLARAVGDLAPQARIEFLLPRADPDFRVNPRGVTMAYVEQGGGNVVHVNPNVVQGYAKVKGTGFMAAGQISDVSQLGDQLEYALQHELGHLVDIRNAHNLQGAGRPDTREGAAFWNTQKKQLSGYGKTKAAEGYAEAYAQWKVGGPGSSAVADAYAAKYGWT